MNEFVSLVSVPRQETPHLDLEFTIKVVRHDFETRPRLRARESVVHAELAREDVLGEVASRCLRHRLGLLVVQLVGRIGREERQQAGQDV